MARAFVGVGSNIEPAANVAKALRLLAGRARVAAVSTVYMTQPEARPEQPEFYNCVVEIETEEGPLELRRGLRRIEAEMGRVRTEDKEAARPIDLDLLAYGDEVVETEELTLPDPEIARHPFVAIPLGELAPDLMLPGPGVRVREAAAELPRDQMEPLESYTNRLRRETIHERREG